MAKDDNEKLNELNRKLDQSVARMKVTEKRCSVAERNARTRRIVKIGAEAECIYGSPIDGKKLEAFVNFLRQQENRGKYFSRALDAADSTED